MKHLARKTDEIKYIVFDLSSHCYVKELLKVSFFVTDDVKQALLFNSVDEAEQKVFRRYPTESIEVYSVYTRWLVGNNPAKVFKGVEVIKFPFRGD